MSRRLPPLEEYQGWVDGEWIDTYEIAQENAAYAAMEEEANSALARQYDTWVEQMRWEYEIEHAFGWLWVGQEQPG